MRVLDLLFVALLVPFVVIQGLPLLHHYEDHHPAAQAPAALSFPSSLGSSSSFAELSFPGAYSAIAATVLQVQAKSLAGLGEFFLLLQPDQEVFATGRNSYAQLGTGTTVNAFAPQKMVNAAGMVDVAAGAAFSCVVAGGTTRQIHCVGNGESGQLGRNSTSSSPELQPVSGTLGGVSEVYCGPRTSFAIMIGSGHVYAWGQNGNGILGVGSSGGNQLVPALVDLPDNFNTTVVAGSESHSCFLSTTGELRCAGWDSWGQVAVADSPETKFVSLSAGQDHTCATATDFMVYCWGQNGFSQMGSPGGNDNTPTPVEGITNARSVWAGRYNTFVIDNNSSSSGAVAFGRDVYGLFGLGSTPGRGTSAVPLVFGEGVTGIVEIRGGYWATCILKQSGDVWCTGDGYYGQLGLGRCKTTSMRILQWGSLDHSCHSTASPTLFPTTSTPTLAPTSSTPTQTPTAALDSGASASAGMTSGAIVGAVLGAVTAAAVVVALAAYALKLRAVAGAGAPREVVAHSPA